MSALRMTRPAPHKHVAKDVVRLLADKHGRDVFFAEVKDGPTWGSAPMRLDALAIRKSWSPVSLFGYEVKVSRSDWLGDRKWEAYRSLAHYFSIVAAPDVVKPEEVPQGVGLLVVSSTGTSLRTVLKCARREIEPPWPLLLYLLMSRTEPSRAWSERQQSREERIERWKKILADSRSIDFEVKDKIRARIKGLESAARRADELAALDRWLDENGGGRWGGLVERVEDAVKAREKELALARKALSTTARRAARLLSGRSSKEHRHA